MVNVWIWFGMNFKQYYDCTWSEVQCFEATQTDAGRQVHCGWFFRNVSPSTAALAFLSRTLSCILLPLRKLTSSIYNNSNNSIFRRTKVFKLCRTFTLVRNTSLVSKMRGPELFAHLLSQIFTQIWCPSPETTVVMSTSTYLPNELQSDKKNKKQNPFRALKGSKWQ